jgi:hypothetical protein
MGVLNRVKVALTTFAADATLTRSPLAHRRHLSERAATPTEPPSRRRRALRRSRPE